MPPAGCGLTIYQLQPHTGHRYFGGYSQPAANRCVYRGGIVGKAFLALTELFRTEPAVPAR